MTTQALDKGGRILRLAALLTAPNIADFIRNRYRASVIPVRTTSEDVADGGSGNRHRLIRPALRSPIPTQFGADLLGLRIELTIYIIIL